MPINYNKSHMAVTQFEIWSNGFATVNKYFLISSKSLQNMKSLCRFHFFLKNDQKPFREEITFGCFLSQPLNTFQIGR